MMIKVNGEYLDFDGDIETESQIKLFEDISTSNGDYSYSFDLSKTNKNLKALGLPFPDTVKRIYKNVPCELVDESGFVVNSGGLQVTNVNEVISCTFFGGNNNWFSLLSEPLSTLQLRKYDVNLTSSNIIASWTKSKGIVFPILDTGTLVTRSFANLKVEDFTPCFYVKDLMNDIFNSKGIKIEGDLIEDGTYNMLTVASNSRSQQDVEDRSSYANKTTTQLTSGSEKVTFEDDSTFPFFDGSKNNFSTTLSRYTADVKMLIKVDGMLEAPGGAIQIIKNGTDVLVGKGTNQDTISASATTTLEAGEYVEIFGISGGAGGTNGINGGFFRVTPVFIYRVFGHSSVPNWTQGEFVSNILTEFNTLPSYNSTSKTLTLNLFNKIPEKEPIDVSQDIVVTDIDFTQFISDYGKSNIFSYQEGSDEDLREYNIANFISYGSGNITVENDFIEDSVDVVSSDFTSPITYLNGVFDISMERINFVELEEIESKEITSITNSGGTPRFNITNADNLFSVGDLVKIETGVDSSFEYEGEWVIKTVTSTYIEVNGPSFGTSADGPATLLRHQFTTDDSVYLFINVPNIQNLFYSSNHSMLLENTTFTSAALAYFNLLSNGREINAKYKQSLSFGPVNNPLNYQKTMLDTYWPIFGKILNDPVMLKVSAYFDRNKYTALKTFLRPLRVKTNDTNNLYYLNRLTGYKNGHEPCAGELIKL